MKGSELPTIVVDTREQLPWDFASPLVVRLLGFPLPTVRGTLPTGDYSLPGLEDQVVIERKSLEDFIGSISSGRDRFKAELERMRGYLFAAVVIEATTRDVEERRYRSNMLPQSVLATALSIRTNYGVHVDWAGRRELAEYMAAWTLRRIWERHVDAVPAARRAPSRSRCW